MNGSVFLGGVPEGLPAMIARGGRAAVAVTAASAPMALVISTYLAIALAGLTLWLAIMFRDPKRTIGKGVVSPADGTVREVDGASGYVSIYLALRNVHVTRAPLDCSVEESKHVMGRHSPAFSSRSSGNERLEITAGTDWGEVSVVEMAGSIARRIVPYISRGQALKKGDRVSLIRFGSRVDVRLPQARFKIVVRKGDKLRAGETTIAEVLHGGLD